MLLKLTSPTQNAVLETIAKLNVDSSVHGILLLNPLASHLQSKHLTNAIIPTKDVDCHCDFNQRMLSELKELSPLLPTVCQSVLFTLDTNCFDPTGKRVVVANDNRRIGLPLCDLLRNRHCHVSNYGIGIVRAWRKLQQKQISSSLRSDSTTSSSALKVAQS